MSDQDTGAILDGKYEIERRLGRGGMGEVFLVRHLHLEELRVVKVMRPEHAADPIAQARFLRAARTATQIKHPNVAMLYDYSSLPDGSYFIVWEYVEGKDIGQTIASDGPCPLPVALDLGIQTLRGLEAIHSAGVIHRDVSPDNLMLTRDAQGRSQVKIIDMGLAKNLEQPEADVTQAGMFMGKMRYCSPEQAGVVKGETLDHRSDLYSFALVLYEMVAGTTPFDSETPQGFVFKRLTEDPIPLAQRVPELALPAQLDGVMTKALARDREERYGGAVELIEALEKLKSTQLGLATREVRFEDSIPAPAPEPSQAPAAPPPERTESQLTREERDALLDQIDRAGKRTAHADELRARADEALEAGDIEAAYQAVEELLRDHPRAAGVSELRNRIEEARQAHRKLEKRARSAEAANILEGYLASRQAPLARLAIETLTEIDPDYSELPRLTQELEELDRESTALGEAQEAAEAGREALARGDLRGARRKLDLVRRHDPSGELSDAFGREIAAFKEERHRSSQIEDRRKKLERHLGRGKLEEAQKEIEQLEELEVTKITLDGYRSRLAGATRDQEGERASSKYEKEVRERLAQADFVGAREATHALEKEHPESPILADLFAEVLRQEEAHRRQEAIGQGLQQVESSIEAGDAEGAATALTILLRLDPKLPKRKQLEKRVRALSSD